MGELVPFQGAQVDWDPLEGFEWTPELLADYANRAREVAWRLAGVRGSPSRLPAWPPGPPCQDCGARTRRRVRVGRFLICPDCGNARSRVAAALGIAA